MGLAALVVLAACGDETSAGLRATTVGSVAVEPDRATISIRDTARFRAVVLSAGGDAVSGATVAWTTSDASIATVTAEGLVRGESPGSARIVAASGGQEGAATVSVIGGDRAVVADACAVVSPPAVPAAVRTFYVDAQAGNDASAGTSAAQAWLTLDRANAAAQPGDLFLLKGTFTNQVIRPSVSGTAARKIVFRALPGASAILKGGKWETIAWLDGRSHVVLDGLELQNEATPVLLRNGANHNWLRNLKIHDVSSALHIVQGSDNRLENSVIERCGNAATNAGDCIWITDGSHRNVVAGNVVRYAGHGTLWVGGDQASHQPSRDNVIERNDFSNPWAGNVGLIGSARGTIVQCNRIHDSSTSGTNYTRSGLQIAADSNVVAFNELYANTADGIQVQAYPFGGMTQNARGNYIYHNTVWGNGGAALQLLQKDGAQVQGNVIENNVFWGNHAAGATEAGRYYEGAYHDVWVDLYNATTDWAEGTLNGNVLRNNILGRDVASAGQSWILVVRRAGNYKYTLSQAQTRIPGVASNWERDPLLVSPGTGNFKLGSSSPAIDAGRVIQGLTFLGAAPDLGANELR